MEITAASFTNEAFANLQPRRPRVAKDPSLPVLAARDEVLAAVRGPGHVASESFDRGDGTYEVVLLAPPLSGEYSVSASLHGFSSLRRAASASVAK